jgi:hypothetical protein
MEAFEARIAEQIRQCGETVQQAKRLIDQSFIWLSEFYQDDKARLSSLMAALRNVYDHPAREPK